MSTNPRDLLNFVERCKVEPYVHIPAIAGPEYAYTKAWYFREDVYLIDYYLDGRHHTEIASEPDDWRERLITLAPKLGYTDPLDLLLHKINISGGAIPYEPTGPCYILRNWKMPSG